jgi:general secretion pathway protein G
MMPCARSLSPRWRGFTLIEMVITVAIVGVLAAGTAPLVELAVQRTKEQELRSALRQLREGIDAYKRAVDEGRIARRAEETGYPRTLDSLIEGVEDAKTTDRRKIYFLRRLPRDPFAAPELDAAATWGKRSYASPPGAPLEGADVFDIYSLAQGVGINGIPYREW